MILFCKRSSKTMRFDVKDTNTLVLSGGGVKGYYYIGIIKYLEDNQILKNINKYAGTSIGAYVCFLLVLNYSYNEILNLFYNVDVSKLIKLSIKNLISENYWGIYDNSNMIKYIKNTFKYKGINENITFKDLYNLNNKYLGIIATNLSKNKEIIFDYINTPDEHVLDAILASINLPILFPKFEINGDIYIDGGFSNNFPINHYISDSNKILGIYLKQQKIKESNIKNIFNYIKSIISYYHNTFGDKHSELINSKINDNVIILYPNTLDIDSVNFTVNNETKKKMIIEGWRLFYLHKL